MHVSSRVINIIGFAKSTPLNFLLINELNLLIFGPKFMFAHYDEYELLIVERIINLLESNLSVWIYNRFNSRNVLFIFFHYNQVRVPI